MTVFHNTPVHVDDRMERKNVNNSKLEISLNYYNIFVCGGGGGGGGAAIQPRSHTTHTINFKSSTITSSTIKAKEQKVFTFNGPRTPTLSHLFI